MNIGKKKGRANKREFINSFKKECNQCGTKENLTFHHLRDKRFGLGDSEALKRSYYAIVMEIEKCIVLCNNCHVIYEEDKILWSRLYDDSIQRTG